MISAVNMTKRELYTQGSLNSELKEFEEVLGDSFCELVVGTIPTDLQDLVDQSLQDVVRLKIQELLKDSSKPKFILYQLPAGQQSLISLSLGSDKKLDVGYRDLDSRPPTKRVKRSIDTVVEEFLKKREKNNEFKW